MKKKFLLASFMMIFGIIIFGAINASAETEGLYTYSVSDGKATITRCATSASGEIIIPDTLGGCPVTSIGNEAFSHCESLKSITIPDSVTSIYYSAFRHCTKLANVNLPDSVTNLSFDAFVECYSLSNINVDESNKNFCSVGGNLFDKNKTQLIQYAVAKTAKEYVIPDSVTSIGVVAFYSSKNLASVTIPNSVTSIGKWAFVGCNQLTQVYYNGPEEDWEKISNVSYNTTLTTATKNFFWYVNLFWEGRKQKSYMCPVGSAFDYAIIPQKTGYTTKIYADETMSSEFDIPSTINQNIDLYLLYKANQYTYKFLDEDRKVLKEETIDYGTVILPPENPSKERTQKYTYTFAEWSGFRDGLTQEDREMVFTATYIATLNQYTYKFIDENGRVLKEKTVDYDTVIEAPNYTPKANTQQYTYTFLGWDGYTDGMQLTDDVTFHAKYEITTNQYTYKFLDEDGRVLKEKTVDYGTIIATPEKPSDKDPYTFDYWQGYTEGITLKNDISFTAVYKYKDYTITGEGLSNSITITYNKNYKIDTQNKDGYNFIGYFTEKDGKGKQITNEKGESIHVYDIAGNLTVFPYFEATHMKKVEMQGTETAMPGDTITQSAIFATDKNVAYFMATVKYPKFLNVKNIKGIDFIEATKASEKTVGEYNYLDIICVYDYEGNFAEANKNHVPFEIEFEVATDAPIDDAEILLENVALVGDETYDITDIKNHTLTILPKLAESIVIEGNDEIDAVTKFGAVVSPDHTTDKSVEWSISDESVATITQDGTVTPIKNGIVTITATAKDGSNVFATKAVNIIAYAKINSLDFGDGVVLTEFQPDVRKYTVYVKENATSISLTPSFYGGVLRPNGSGIWISGRSMNFSLQENGTTTITLNRENVTNMTNSVYTVEVIKFEGTKNEVSEDKKSFTITPVNIETGKTVILALYDGEQFVEMQSAIYTGETIPFTTTKTYTKAKVMVWDDLKTLKSATDVEIIE